MPHDGIGYAKLALDGPDMDLNCASAQWTSYADYYPVLNIMTYRHDSMAMRFDAYYGPDGGSGMQRSSDPYSNAVILKHNDHFYLSYNYNRPLGTAFNWLTGFDMNCQDGSIKVPGVRATTLAVGDGPQPLYIDNYGKLGMNPGSSINVKENVRDTTASDTEYIYALRPVMFDYKDSETGKNQCGLIAEEVHTVCPRMVIYQRDITYLPPSDPNDPNAAPEPVVTTTDIPAGVNYEKLIVPMLAEMQRLRQRVDELEARLAVIQE
ncbi:MAG: tail fiber domain-containing protein [Candidatus Hydrogenedentes bacterium]|nr:tail fiber domain-containing protein [Candidatus Hydrogenedentota bacterium]